ncbi:MAG: hydrogenase formation protein HypD [Chlorobium sp.]|jgi:hydrogenase expression/formation protein HypD|uniref:hydrogenase formation protein HypD n=1 Tax=Chlorobium sp. TaxID=1095 RepID=UPI0025BB717B|nr:hydrogenase formation protein HypD [Chlorobium sp.]MCF8216282.1 hydrogenase formation protein HypD [Chlorobium sp.]MCF8271184.1 hydrogenase formation protein HypD [Chlorobium sp.]MCF8287552.1 hydrogenase formation protein HypD [Chlorobium sp.]MCF8291097.1 hydrogenase formation protein HypD [Chlorobium sp.]MCF8385186.1 hydrogenase formation protein HypD [Chlorobium sp.]
MKHFDEYRDPQLVRRLVEEVGKKATRRWTIMEICGGQTHSIMRNGIDQLLEEAVELVHGPGCPVCVTPLETIDHALAIAMAEGVIFTTFGDMLRVPGSGGDLFSARSRGADVRMVYSPLEALRIARENPLREVVFFAVGFETTVPANAMSVWQAAREGIRNFSILCSQVMVPPAMRMILSSPDNRVQGFLAAGHVCAITGYEEYEPLCREFHVPIVPTGFEPVDLLSGILKTVEMLEEGRAGIENRYGRVVAKGGNPHAREAVERVFEVADRQWRGIGMILGSGLVLRQDFRGFDASERFGINHIHTVESPLCRSGQVLQGYLKPDACHAFGRECTPQHPLGATMVSSEGACAAYYRYHRNPFLQ